MTWLWYLAAPAMLIGVAWFCYDGIDVDDPRYWNRP